MSTVTLIDGREVDQKSWFVDCDRRVMEDHVRAMWGLDKATRDMYLDGVLRSQGPLWREAVAMRYAALREEADRRRAAR